jgi:hypothetical protein
LPQFGVYIYVEYVANDLFPLIIAIKKRYASNKF